MKQRAREHAGEHIQTSANLCGHPGMHACTHKHRASIQCVDVVGVGAEPLPLTQQRVSRPR